VGLYVIRLSSKKHEEGKCRKICFLEGEADTVIAAEDSEWVATTGVTKRHLVWVEDLSQGLGAELLKFIGRAKLHGIVLSGELLLRVTTNKGE